MAVLQTGAPKPDDKYFIQQAYGGYNPCIPVTGKSVLHNCTGFAWGCFAKAGGMKSKCKLPTNAAENWIERNTAYKTGFKPKVGGVMVWRGGDIHSSADGDGHVAFVISVVGDKVTILEDGYYRQTIITTTLYPPYNYGSMQYIGCIYHPTYVHNPYKVGGTYTVTNKGGIYIRKTAKPTSRIKQTDEVTADARKHCKYKKGNAVLKASTKVTVLEIKQYGKNIRARIPSGWINVTTATGRKVVR